MKQIVFFNSSLPAEAFRKPLPVVKIRVYQNGNAFPVCPRCDISLEREYQCFCDRCGQALEWSRY